MPQQSLSDFVDDTEKAGLLVRVTDEKRVDELPAVMEAHPLTAVLVEKVTDCEFQFLANAYSNQDKTAWALGCEKSETGRRMVELGKGRITPEVVDTAPCKEVILTGDDVDLTRLLQLGHRPPANAEIVLECVLMCTEGLTHDEGPDGEFTGMYGGGIKANYRAVVKAMTFRRGGIFQHATIGGKHPWYTDDNAVQFAMAFRYMPHLDTVTIGCGNTMTVDPMIADDAAPGTASKVGLDCTIPISPKFVRSHFDRSTVFELGGPSPDVVVKSEEELTAEMAALIGEAPRTWKEILQHFNGQPYRTVYGALSNLRHRLGRCEDEPWYRYTFSDTDFAVSVEESEPSNFDPRHRD